MLGQEAGQLGVVLHAVQDDLLHQVPAWDLGHAAVSHLHVERALNLVGRQPLQ